MDQDLNYTKYVPMREYFSFKKKREDTKHVI